MARYSNVRQKSNGNEMSENETKLKTASCNDHFKTGNMKGEKKHTKTQIQTNISLILITNIMIESEMEMNMRRVCSNMCGWLSSNR